MKIDKPGIYNDFPSQAYFDDPCSVPSLTQSIAKVLIEQSELHAKAEHPRLAPPTDDDEEAEKYVKAQAIGNAAHLSLIGRGKKIAVGQFDDWRKKEAQAFKDDALLAGQVPILHKHSLTAHAMVLAAKLQLIAIANETQEQALHAAFKVGNGEVVVAAEVNGIWMRSLIDWMVDPRVLIDFKTTAMSVAPHSIPNLMANAGWPIQAATQDRILDVLDPKGAGKRRFFFIAQENYLPYALTVHELPRDTMTLGHKMLDKAETMWREAMRSNSWPGYPAMIHKPEYPSYVEAKWLDREIADAAHARVPKREPLNPEILMAG